MLTCYGHEVRLPHSDLAYLAFRLAVEETLSDIELYRDLEEEPDYPAGYLSEVPFLEHVPLQVQVDLLAETWNRHRQTELIEASLLDAAIVYAACQTAARIIEDMPEVAAAYLRDGPRQLKTRILRRAAHRLEDMFDTFWDDDDFLLLDELQDCHRTGCRDQGDDADPGRRRAAAVRRPGPLARVAGCGRKSAGPADRRRDRGGHAAVDRCQVDNGRRRHEAVDRHRRQLPRPVRWSVRS